MRNMVINLQNLINRIDMFNRILEKHPEHSEHYQQKIKDTEELIVKAVKQNSGSFMLTQIHLIE